MVAEAQPESEHGRHMALSAGPLCKPCQPTMDHRIALQTPTLHVNGVLCTVHLQCNASLPLLCS